jgi:transposase
VKQEKLDWLADSPFHTKRFAFWVGRRCRAMSIRDVARETHLDWKTVKALEKQYMAEQIRRAGTPAPKVIGIDELSVRKGHTYRIIVSDLVRRRAIWFGGTDRKEASMDLFYQELGEKKSRGIRLAVMDMWRPFENSTAAHAPQAARLYDKFHALRHLADAMDEVRRNESIQMRGDNRRLIRGHRYTLLTRRANLTINGKRALRILLKANKRLNTAYLLTESFGQLWEYRRERWARRFFDHWRASLEGQGLQPFERFAEMIDRHWEGIAAYCREENKVSLGFVEGLNNKIRVIQRRAYGLRDEEYLRLKILTCTLPEI